VFQDTASALFGVEGLRVTDAQAGPGGALEVWAVTDWPGAAACPDCGALSDRPHETVLARPRDARRAGDPVDLRWVKRRWKCTQESCERKTFTERLPQVPPRCRVTARLREQAAREVEERGVTPAEAARHAGLSWPVVHDAFAARADRALGPAPAPAAHLGIDEHRRGRPRWRRDEETGEYVQLADRWRTCFYDLSGEQGMLGQVEGRTADDAAYWLAGASPAWRDAVRVVAIDMCTIYASAVRRMLPGAVIAVDLFHVVQLAVKTLGDVRRRAIREKYGRRGKSGDPEYGIKNLLARNLENLRPDQFAKVIDTLDADADGQQIALAWIAKEKLRDAEPPRPRHRQHAVRAAGPGPAVRLLRLVRAERGHPRAHQPRGHHLPLGKRDRHRDPDRRDQRTLREPEPDRQARGPHGLRVPEPGEPAPTRPHCLHPRHPQEPITHRNRQENTTRKQQPAESRLTGVRHCVGGQDHLRVVAGQRSQPGCVLHAGDDTSVGRIAAPQGG
jgi:transposase